jgi:hypothetical protein
LSIAFACSKFDGALSTIWLLILLFKPYWLCRKKASIIGIAAIFQPLAHFFGVQLTFFIRGSLVPVPSPPVTGQTNIAQSRRNHLSRLYRISSLSLQLRSRSGFMEHILQLMAASQMADIRTRTPVLCGICLIPMQ